MIHPPPLRVLLLDDDPEQLKMIQLGLWGNDRSIEAITATDAEMALGILREGGFDCVVSDYLMPGLDGLRFCARLREEENDIPFILFTGQGSEEVAEKAFGVGVDDYLRKENTLAIYAVLARNIRSHVEKHRAKEALRVSEEKYRQLVRFSPSGIYDVDFYPPRFTSVNEAMCRILGYTEEELLALGPMAILTPESAALFRDRIHRVQAGEEVPNSTEYKVNKKDGSTIWGLLNIRFRFIDGKIVGASVVAHDVTERKMIEEALRKVKEDLDRAQEVGQIGSWRLDVQRNQLTWSDETHRIFGIPQGTTLNYETFIEAVHPEDKFYVDARWQAALSGEPYDIEHRIKVGTDTKWIREKGYLEFDKAGRLLGGFGIAQDITERKLAEEKLRISFEQLKKSEEELASQNEELQSSEEELAAANEELRSSQEQLQKYSMGLEEVAASRTKRLIESEQRLSSFINSAPDLFYIYDGGLNLVDCNEAVLKGYPGVNKDNLLGKNLTEITPCIGRSELIDAFRRVIETGAPEKLPDFKSNPSSCENWVSITLFKVGENLGVVSRDITARKGLEDELRRSQERLRAFMDSSTEGFSIWDSELRLVEANETWMRRWPEGTKWSDVLGKGMTELYPGVERTDRWSKYLNVIRTGEPFSYENALAGDRVKKGVFSASVFRVGDGLGIVSNDVTEKRSLEEDLDRNRERLQAFMDSATETFTLYDENLNLLDVNASALSRLPDGTREEDLIGKNILDVYPGFSDSNWYGIYMEVLKTGVPYFTEAAEGVAAYSGRVVSASIFKVGRGLGVISRDVTERVRMEQDLRQRTRELSESRERLLAFMESATEGFSLYDKGLNLIDVNSVVLNRYPKGTRKEDIVGKYMGEIYPGFEKTRWYTSYMRLLETGEPFHFDAEPGVGYSANLLLETSAFKVGDGVGVITRDVTHEVEMEAKLRDGERGEAIDRISSMVAHDIRSPLNTAYQALEMAKMKPENSENLTAMAARNVSRAIEMIEELRENTRIIEPKRKSVNLTQLLDDTLREKHLPESIPVLTEYGEGLGDVSLDPSLMRRIVENLLSNAADAMPAGGRVRVAAWLEGVNVIVSVSDTGAGIPPEAASKIFTPLFTTKSKGVGLGLSYCRRAVEAHGGAITFTSTPGSGTTFTLRIPQ